MDVWIVVLLKYIHSLPKPTILLNNIQVRIESMFARIVGKGKFDLLSENLYSTQASSQLQLYLFDIFTTVFVFDVVLVFVVVAVFVALCCCLRLCGYLHLCCSLCLCRLHLPETLDVP